MRVKEWLVVLVCFFIPIFGALLNSGCGNSPTSSSSATPTATPFAINSMGTPVNGSNTPCVESFGFYDKTGIGLTPLPQNQYVALRFGAPATPDYPNFSGSASMGSAGIYAANAGNSAETIELAAYGNESRYMGPLYGQAVNVVVPAYSLGDWQVVNMPLLSFTDMGPDVYLAAHALGADLSIGAKGTNSGPAVTGSVVGSIVPVGNIPTPTANVVPAPNYEMFLKSCP